jgi:hypothetical protein
MATFQGEGIKVETIKEGIEEIPILERLQFSSTFNSKAGK